MEGTIDLKIYWAFDKDLPEEYQFLRKNRGKLCRGEIAVAGIIRIEDIEILVELNNDKMERCTAKYARIALYKPDKMYIPMITIDSNYYDSMRLNNLPDDNFAILHELGHYFTGQMKVDDIKTNEELNEKRYTNLINKVIPKDEIDADMFAAEILGAESVAKYLKISKANYIGNSIVEGMCDDESSSLVRWEYDQRIKAMERLSSL